jgi:hypothetical protein
MLRQALIAIGLSLTLLTSPEAVADDIVDRGLQRLRDANHLDPQGNRTQGGNFDRLVKEFYDKMVDDGFAERIDTTFAGDNIENGYRIGRREIWVQKQDRTANTQRSLDIIVWDVDRDANGRVTRARGVGMDHHTYHPEAPRAPQSAKDHWNDKKATAQLWERILQRKGIDARIEMNPDNSFYWKEAAAAHAEDLERFHQERAARARERHRGLIGGALFSTTGARALGSSLAVLGTAANGVAVIEALEQFYRSPVLSRTIAHINAGRYDEARRYWEEQCLVLQTAHRDCDGLRIAIAEASSLLSARVFTDWPTFMNMLFDKWVADARSKKPWVGVWKTTWGDLTLTQPDNRTIEGTYTYRRGRLGARTDADDPRKITGSWQEGNANSDEYRGWIEFNLAEDGNSFEGKWGKGYGNPLDGKWVGQRK